MPRGDRFRERLGHADPAITAKVYTRKMRDRRRELSFLDDLGSFTPNERVEQQMGNAWATQHPEISANPAATTIDEIGD